MFIVNRNPLLHQTSEINLKCVVAVMRKNYVFVKIRTVTVTVNQSIYPFKIGIA